jgi:hypothetical protein
MVYHAFMIEKGAPIVPGMFVRHDEGLLYQVDDTRQSTVDYETTRQLGVLMVDYTQKEPGHFPVGTKWVKDEEGFRNHFTIAHEQIGEQR